MFLKLFRKHLEKILLELGFKDISGTIEYNGEFIFTGSDQLWIK